MKILIIHTVYNVEGGEEVIVQNESRLLQSHGINVLNLYFTNATKPIRSVLGFLQLPFNFTSYRKVQKTIKEFGPDIVHLHNWNYAGSLSIIRAAVDNKIPVILSIHNFRLLCPSGTLFKNGSLFLNSLEQTFPWKAIKNKVYRNSRFQTFWLALSIHIHKKVGTWNAVDYYLVNTPFIKHLFLRSGLGIHEEKLIVKPNSSPEIGYRIDNRSENFVFVGRLNQEKGIFTLIKAFKESHFNLVIIGDGPLRSYVEESASLYKNITYKGRLPHTEVISEVKCASALIFPSEWYEGMPMTIVEALSMGTPVISSYIGAMKDMIQNEYNGLHFEPGNPSDLKSKINIWSGINEEEKMKYRMRARVSYEQQYTPEVNLERLLMLYKQLL